MFNFPVGGGLLLQYIKMTGI